jgi:hypothetical protein
MHCLDLEEYKEVLIVHFYNCKNIGDCDYVHEIFEECKYWENRIVGINYFFSIVLERLSKEREVNNDVIDYVYKLSDSMNFEIQEFTPSFIKNLYSNFTTSNRSLIEEIIDAQKYIYE